MINTTDDDIVELMDIDNDKLDTRYEETSTTRTKATATTTMTTHEKMSNNNNDNCIKGEHSGVVEARSTIRNSSNRYPGYRPSSSSSSSSINNNIRDSSDESDLPAICIELVGSRFLRRMVRILTVRR